MSAFGVWTCPTCNVTYEETDGHECVASDLAARVAELELDREGRIRSSDYDKALIEELEAEVAVLSGTACAEEQAEGNGPCGACRTCRNKRITELEAREAKLRKCVEAADTFVEAAVDIDSSPAMMSVYTIAEVHHCPYNGANWSGELANYRAARAEVDK